MAGDRVSANPGVAVKANAENVTADAVAILGIVFMTLSNGVLAHFAMSAMVAGLVMKSLLWCKQSKSRRRDCPAVMLRFAFATSSVDKLQREKPGRGRKCSHRLRNYFSSVAVLQGFCFNLESRKCFGAGASLARTSMTALAGHP
jgi:hypothetical protein